MNTDMILRTILMGSLPLLAWAVLRAAEPAAEMKPYAEAIPGSKVQLEMVPIPGGFFTLGSPEDEKGRKPAEGPRFEVEVEPFWMGKYEITWAQYKKFMELHEVFRTFRDQKLRQVTDENRADAVSIPTPLYEPGFTFRKGQEENHPAVTMSQFAAKQFTKWLSRTTGHFYRLPTEVEWEYACRAGSTTAYGFGEDAAKLGDYAWFEENAKEKYHPVGQKLPNKFGLYDMHGNVSEWVLDEYRKEWYTRFAGKKIKGAEAICWPEVVEPRVIRGGSWYEKAEECRSASRLGSQDKNWRLEDPNSPLSPWWFTEQEAQAVGFRIVRPLREPSAEEQRRYWDADVEEIRHAVENKVKEKRGVEGLADQDLPAAIEKLKK